MLRLRGDKMLVGLYLNGFRYCSLNLSPLQLIRFSLSLKNISRMFLFFKTDILSTLPKTPPED